MPSTYTHQFDTPTFKGSSTINTGLFINNEWVDPVQPETIDVVNPSNGKFITKISIGSAKDVDLAVKAARTAFKTNWGLNCPGSIRGGFLNKFADLLEQHVEEIAALEALDNGKPLKDARNKDVAFSIKTFRYYAGWAGKVYGKTIETNPAKFAYTREEPIGVCGQIIPWNYPLMMASLKLGPALATGCAVILKPSENTPLSVLRMCDLLKEAGFPPGVVNVVNGYGNSVGQAIIEHHGIDKVAFTGSTLVGRKIAITAAETNLKAVSLELGGKSPNIIFDDADLDQALAWSAFGIFANAGQACCAGSRIFVQEGIHDAFLKGLTKLANERKLGDAFHPDTEQGPQVSQIQFDRVLGYIDAGKKAGATVHVGGERHGTDGFFIQPTIFTGVAPDMSIVKEEIFGPVAVLIKFKTDEEVIQMANDSTYGLACAVFSQNITRALTVAHSIDAGTAYINNCVWNEPEIPFGGYKQSGWGRDLGEYALRNYTQTKAVHVNLGFKL